MDVDENILFRTHQEDNSVSYVRKKNSELIKHILKQTYTDLNESQLRKTTLQAIFAPENRKIAIAGREITASDLRYELARNIEHLDPSLDQNEIDDTVSEVAMSIENINSGTNSVEEYFSWLDETTDILKNMNDGFVSEEDLELRNNFLDNANQREVELMLCVGMLEGSKHPNAEENARRIRYKLQKLREMRSAVEFATRNQSDVEISRAEYERAIPYYKMFKALQKLPFGYDVNRAQKESLGLNHDDDDDLSEDYNHYHNVINEALDEILEKDSYIYSKEYQLAYDMAKEKNMKLSDEISEKMKKLTGRKNSFRLKYESLDSEKTEV